VEHPLNVNLREDAIIGQVDDWLTLEFAPHRLAETIRDLAAAQQPDMTRDASGDDETVRKIADCDAKLAQYRAALDAGANSATVAAWIAETEAERATYTLAMRRSEPRLRRMTAAEIKAIVDKLTDIARVLHEADPEDKGEIFRQLGLKLTYHPGRRLVQAEVQPVQYGFSDGVRGGT
jgi:site-specific DNA recombinase